MLASSRGARMPNAWVKPKMAVTNTSLRKQTVLKSGRRLIQRIGGWSFKSKPYNQKAAMPNWKQMAGFLEAKMQGLNQNNDWIVSCLLSVVLITKFIWYCCHGLLATNILSLLLISSVFAMLRENYTKRYFPSLQALSGRQLYSLHLNPRNLA